MFVFHQYERRHHGEEYSHRASWQILQHSQKLQKSIKLMELEFARHPGRRHLAVQIRNAKAELKRIRDGE